MYSVNKKFILIFKILIVRLINLVKRKNLREIKKINPDIFNEIEVKHIKIKIVPRNNIMITVILYVQRKSENHHSRMLKYGKKLSIRKYTNFLNQKTDKNHIKFQNTIVGYLFWEFFLMQNE